ncbi:hypothetical protein KKA14_19255 [bacterium]|nr:hypothetical protein [bacterium]
MELSVSIIILEYPYLHKINSYIFVMIANILLVSADDFPIDIEKNLEKSGFSCSFSRGVLKTKEILESKEIDTIIWLFMGHERALAKDLLKIFNTRSNIPIIFMTQSYDELDFAEDIKGIFANIDLNDDMEDIIRTVETACNQSIIVEEEPTSDDTHEIDFKNAVSQIIENQLPEKASKQSREKSQINKINIWNAVDKREKRILSTANNLEEKKKLFPKIRKIFDRQ